MNPLPSFRKPPVAEVAIAAQFGEIRGLTGPHMGLLWQRYRESFPTLEVHPALDPRFERPDPAPGEGLTVKFGTVPTPRAWFIGTNQAHLIQVQQDRFVFNWRRIPGEDYPRHGHVRASFRRNFGIFEQFLLDEQLGEPSLNQWELTYVNHIPAGNGWHRHGEVGSVVPLLVRSMKGEFLPEPEDVALRVRYSIPDGDGAVSRLHVVADPGFDSSGNPGIVLTLTARGGAGTKWRRLAGIAVGLGPRMDRTRVCGYDFEGNAPTLGARAVTILEHVAESQVDSWRGLTDSKRPRARRIQLSEQSAPVLFLTAPWTSIFPARSDEVHWLIDVTDEMQSYLTLAPDWDSYGGGPVRKSIADAALRVAEVMARTGFSRPDICPQSSGGVLLEWQQSDRVLTVDLDGIEGFSFAYESPGVESEGGIEDFVSLLRAGLQPF